MRLRRLARNDIRELLVYATHKTYPLPGHTPLTARGGVVLITRIHQIFFRLCLRCLLFNLHRLLRNGIKRERDAEYVVPLLCLELFDSPEENGCTFDRLVASGVAEQIITPVVLGELSTLLV